MATIKQKIEAEQRVRELVEREGLPLPDRVEYGHTCIWLLWEEQQVAVRVDIDEFADASPQDLAALDVIPPTGSV